MRRRLAARRFPISTHRSLRALLIICLLDVSFDAQVAGGADLCARTLLMDLDGVLTILRIQSLVYFRLERP